MLAAVSFASRRALLPVSHTIWRKQAWHRALCVASPRQRAIAPGDYEEYERIQRELPCRQAPLAFTDIFELLDPETVFAFADNSAFLRHTWNTQLTSGKTILIRPRRFGKTVFGLLWLEFFKGHQILLQNLAIASTVIPEPSQYVCVSLDLSSAEPLDFLQFLTLALNKSLAAAMLPQIDLQPTIGLTFEEFVKCVQAAQKKCAFFVDEYDSMVLKCQPNFHEALTLTAQLFLRLKAHRKSIPFVFITGSSRVAIAGLWSGANDIEDISYNASLASALGYSWDQISTLFTEQLRMLQELHDLPLEGLRKKIEFMYHGHRFSPDSKEMVFNPWAINRLLQSGRFDPHFAESGLSHSLAAGSLPEAELLTLGIPGSFVNVSMPHLRSWRYCEESASEPLSVWVRLLTAGILTLDRQGQQVQLKVPNEDARFALTEILPAFAHGVDSSTFATMLHDSKIPQAVRLLQRQVQKVALGLAENAAGAEGLLECHLQQAFFAVIYQLWRKAETRVWRVTSEVRVCSEGNSPRPDFLITVGDSPATYHAFEFGLHRSDRRASLKNTVLSKLEQADKYMDVARDEEATRITVAIWSQQGVLLCIAGPYTRTLAAEKVSDLKADESKQWRDLL